MVGDVPLEGVEEVRGGGWVDDDEVNAGGATPREARGVRGVRESGIGPPFGVRGVMTGEG